VCGTPVIASTRDGSHEALANSEFGVLVDPHAPDEIAQAILTPQDAPSPAAVRDRFGPAAYREQVRQAIQGLA
jgi:glycosyltransferase involved in cell wall biosynthesis